MHSMACTPTPAPPKRGRKERESKLPPSVRRAIRKFSNSICKPQVLSSTGFRDFRGWLRYLSSTRSLPQWDELLSAVVTELGGDKLVLERIKVDIVRDIIKYVVVPRPEESAKLVYTNARRQASRPRSGMSLMVVLDEQLERVLSPQDFKVVTLASLACKARYTKLPAVNDVVRNPGRASTGDDFLPSFQELDRSLQAPSIRIGPFSLHCRGSVR